MRGLLFLLLVLAQAGGAYAQTPPPAQPATQPASTTYAQAHRNVSTANPQAQATFDDGLTLLYAFNPEAARSAFERATRLDPSLAMAWWGIGMSYGVNINTEFDPAAQRQGREAIAKAAALATNATAAERALVAAAVKRFAVDRKADADRSARAYRDAMNAVAADFPNDDDVLVLAAESELDAHPWDYWTRDGKPQPGTLANVERLETVLARSPGHLGANHYLIHALEASPYPERALDAARRLDAQRFEPAAEHLTHMPAHIFMRVGLYHQAAEANLRAVAALRAYLDGEHASGHDGYLAHDCLFGVDAFMMSGESANATHLVATCGRESLERLVNVRFRRWKSLRSDENPGDFAAGMAEAATGQLEAATLRLRDLRREGSDVAKITAGLLQAKIAAGHGDRDGEIRALEEAVAVQDGLGYQEPPPFWYPVRESLGAALFRAGRYADSERVFREDLARNPNNPRSLFGLSQSLAREGLDAQAQATQHAFAEAWRQADVTLDMKDL